MRTALRLTAVLLLVAMTFVAHAQSEVSYSDDFQSYGTQANPPGWIDTSVGLPKPEAAGLYKTWGDPEEKKSPNVVYGTKQSSGQPEGNNPRIGTFSTLSSRTFAGKGRFEYRGRIWRGDADGRIGLTFFSSYPTVDSYYLIGLWSQPNSANLTMQLFAFGAGTITGTRDSHLTLAPLAWYRFLIQVDDADGQTKIRARFWPEDDPEPSTFSIDAVDASPSRLTSGRIGMWGAVKGDNFIDDIFAKSPVDHTPPTIVIRENGEVLADGTKFNRNAVPEIVVTDDLSTFTVDAKLDGAPYTSLTPVTSEGWHTLTVHAVDGPGNAADAQVKFLVDKTAPVVAILEGTTPFPPDFFFNRDVIANASVTDISNTVVTATLDGQPYTPGTPIAAEGLHSISVTAVDEVGWSTTAGPIAFTIDKTPPALTFTSHTSGDVLTAAHAIISGGSDDAVTVLVNGSPVTVDTAAKVFATGDLSLLEGENTIVATGTDRAGNSGSATLKLFVDTRAPEVSIVTPDADACVDGSSVSVSGTATDARLDVIKVTIGSNTVTATIGANGAWSASVPVATEGRVLITVEATDKSGHTASSSRTVSIDRTAPAIEILQSGAPFTDTLVNRAVSLFVRVNDADPNATLTVTLDGNAYTNGTAISAEGAHTLVTKASDCAGHTAEKSVSFTIDTTPPTIRNLDPQHDATVGSMPSAIRGATDTDVASVRIETTQLVATPNESGAFVINGVAFAEGTNTFRLVATDRAGNVGTFDYVVRVKTIAPAVEILESGLAIVNDTLYTRAVTPVVRSNDTNATLAATLNGAPFTSGTTIDADGAYTIHATATDTFGHAGSADVRFSIDRTPPVVTISAPADNATIRADRVDVHGSAGDSVYATLNGQTLTLAADGSFVVQGLPLDIGLNTLVVVGRDRAGNSGRASIVVTRDDLGAGIILTYPPDRSITNRATTDVVGRLLTAGRGTTVTVGGQSVELDATGGFRVTGYALTEGENAITATATATNGVQTSATTHVTADFTPPALAILESGQALADNARFATEAVVSLDASDSGGGAVTTELSIDGTKITAAPFTVTTAGGHAAVATARDLAGNEARVERTFFIGTEGGGSSDCRLEGFDPVDGAVILSNTTTLVGRSGSALGVKVNGVAAIVADGAFAATVELPNEGANIVTIACTDAQGTPTGTPVTFTLQRVTGDPSIAISTPAEGATTGDQAITVTGTVGNGVVSADVNGVAATISGNTFTAGNVHLADGLNILTAHGRNAAGRVATASRRVTLLGTLPTISIGAPLPNATTGANRIDVSGTYTNLVPSTLTLRNVETGQTFSVTATVRSDTTGTFLAENVALTSGEQTLRVSGRDALNREATATVVVKLVAGTPSIVIDAPLDNAVFGPGSDEVAVSGTFTAAAGSTVDVNGVAATLNGNAYSATAKFSTLAGGITPIVARVTEPGGASAVANVIVTQVVDAPRVVEAFPAPDTAEVDAGALLLVLFSQPMNGATMDDAFRLETSNGTPVSGALRLEKDVLTFAPATPLAYGQRYTIKVSTAAKNLAGTALAAAFSSSFTVATTAPATPPVVTPVSNAVCGESITVAGTATPSARVRLESGALILNGVADASGKFAFTYPISGQSGFALIRVRVVGSDGSVSPAAELNVRVDCSGPSVLNASYDRNVNKLTIQFSETVDPSTITVGAAGSILLTENGSTVDGSASADFNLVTVTPAADLRQKTFTLSVSTQIEDTIGNHLVAPYTQEFTLGGEQPVSGEGSGFISGEVYDATTGRPLAGAAIAIDVAAAAPVATVTDARGRYLARLPEGAHTIQASLGGYTTVWREIIVPAGAGVIPIDIRLTKRGTALTHGGDTAITKPVELTIPSGGQAIPPVPVSVTSVGAQALPGLLPLGWSPVAAAEVEGALTAGTLTFSVPASEISAATQNLSAVQYDSARDEWRVLASVVAVGNDGKTSFPISGGGAYALVYPDKAPGLITPPLPVAGDVLQGVPAAAPDAPAMVDRDFTLDPQIVLPNGRTVATLRIEGGGEAKFPSGTAVQAYIDEDLRLADGSRLLDPPFATDLLLYRNPAGDLGVADFHLAPSAKAAQVVLEIGFDHIRILPYPGRLDRGTLIGSEGGRVPADDKVAVEIPTGAVPEPLRATATSLTDSDLAAVGSIAGFRVVGGFQLTLQRATQPAPQDLDEDGQPDAIGPVELFVPARATFTVDASKLPSRTAQVILGELLDDTPYGKMVRLAVPMMAVDATSSTTPAMRFTTKTIDRSLLPVDGVVHEGRYVVLAAENPIAFATGTVHMGALNGRLVSDARVTAPPLGVAELSRETGIYNIPVPATTFTLVPRHPSTGDGAAYTHPSAAAIDSVNRVDLPLVAQPPVLGSVVVLRGNPPSQATLSAALTTDVSLTTNIRASFTPGIDATSISADSITVTNAVTGERAKGRATAEGSVAVLWTLDAGERLAPNARYLVVIAPSIRGTNGATIAHGASFSFATVTQVLNSEIHRERIRITIPDANGVSRITGIAGALPAGWQAVAVRRIKDFFVRYQATAANDGSFSFDLGNGDARDRVTMSDLIDLQVVNNNGALAGIFALTPFVTADGKGFVAPPDVDVKFTSPEGITVAVPAGAFDVPTIVNVTSARKEEFLDIPRIEDENEYATSVDIEFEGWAKKPLDVEVAVPAGFDTAGKNFILAWKGMSTRGPRLAVADVMHVENGKFTTIPDEATNSRLVTVTGLKTGVNRTLTGRAFRDYLIHLIRGGRYMVLDIKQPVGGAVGWGVMEGLQAGYDLMWDIFWSYYDPYIHVFERAARVIPVIQGKPFTVYGIDRATGLQAFQRTYDPIPIGDPGSITPIPSPQQNDGGPYPVFGSPFRVAIVDLDVEDLEIRSVRNFKVLLANNNVTVTPGDQPLDGDVKVQVLNVKKGTTAGGTAGGSITLGAELGDRIVLLIEQKDVDAGSPVSIVMNEPLYLGTDPDDPEAVDTFLHGALKLEQAPEPAAGGAPSFTDITPHAKFSADSGERRINIELPGALQRDAVYRLTLKGTLADVTTQGEGLKLGQGTTADANGNLSPVGGGFDLPLLFHTRKPAGEIGSFLSADTGIVRGLDQYNNVLYVGTVDSGLRAFDVSNPAAINGTAPLLATVGPPNTAYKPGPLTIDRHGRIFTLADLNIVSCLLTYRTEDFEKGIASAALTKSSTITNWKLGYSSMIGLPSNTILSDRPESIPFRVKVVEQDDTQEYANREDFVNGTGASETGNYPLEDMKRYTVSVPYSNSPYNYQRITVENVTLDMRWSADAQIGSSASISNVLARSGDVLRVVSNRGTYAVVAHLGYGVGVYNVNAMESNRHPSVTAATKMREQVFLGNGIVGEECHLDPPDYAIGENYLNTDVEVHGEPSGDIYVYAIHPTRGVLDYQIHLPGSSGGMSTDASCDLRGPTGLLFDAGGYTVPRIAALKSAIQAAGGNAYAHFMNMSQVHWSVSAADNAKGLRGSVPNVAAERDYVLVASLDYGVIVFEASSDPATTGSNFPLDDEHVADVLWIPGGATGVRVMQESNVAVVHDRNGRVVLVDLSRIDERWDADGNPTSGLFPTAKKAIAGTPTDPGEVGADDPRIIWKSEPGITSGALPPVFDSSTGIIYGANQTARRVKAVAAIDPTVRMKVNLGGMKDVGGIVPLGIAPSDDIKQKIQALDACGSEEKLDCKENASMGAFRLEVSLPGGMTNSLTSSNNELWLAVESERIAGAITEQTPNGFPRSHLRRRRRDGSPEASGRAASSFIFKRVVPEAVASSYKYQRGYNKFISPWIVAIADPRASEEYDWHGASAQQKEEAGCYACERPEFLKNHGESEGIYELYTNGRYLTVRPELTGSDNIFTGTEYDYLGRKKRMDALFTTIMADTVRPTEVTVAAQNPPRATGMIQDTLFLHSGEVQTSAVDLNAGGRANVDVAFERTYRSRTIGGSFMGVGWDSPLFRRIRALPNGDVEYRDGAEVWRFQPKDGGYASPKGLYLRLSRTAVGWRIVDQSWRITDFDDLGRVTADYDEFYKPDDPNSGNVIRYVYDDAGRLAAVMDPVKRTSKIEYWSESQASATGAYPGYVREITDWRDRKIDYEYDSATATLVNVKLPDVANTSGGRPAVHYGYTPAGSSYSDMLELRGNLQSITEPHENVAGGGARVKFDYSTAAGFMRDRATRQEWATGESASFTYASPTEATTTDALGQVREYSLTEQPKDYVKDRAHIEGLKENAVKVSDTPFGELPTALTVGVPQTSSRTRTYAFEYDEEGEVTSSSLDGVRSMTIAYKNVEPEAPGEVVQSSTTEGTGDSVEETYDYQNSGNNSQTQVDGTTRDGETIKSQEGHRGNLTPSANANNVFANKECGPDGLTRKITTSGGTSGSSTGGSPASNSGSGTSLTISHHSGDDPALHRRGLLSSIDRGSGIATSIQYPSPTQKVVTDERGVVSTIERDAWERTTRASIDGPGLALDESVKYDANGRPTEVTRVQDGTTVTMKFEYDALGRVTKESIDNVAGGGVATTQYTYDLTSRSITTTHPGGAVTTTTLDSLGRIEHTHTETGSSPLEMYYAYDLDDNLVYQTDLLSATAMAYDSQGRLIGRLYADGTKSVAEYDAWGNPTKVQSFDAAGSLIGETTFDFTAAGELQSATNKVDASQSRDLAFTWDAGMRPTGLSVSGRAAESTYDSSGRLLDTAEGEGDASAVTNAFEETEVSGHDGTLPQTMTRKEKGGTAYDIAVQYNTNSDAVVESIGGLTWSRSVDEAGNVTSVALPNRGATTYDYDSRGSVEEESLPGGGSLQYVYTLAGGLKTYVDPTNEDTQITTDLIGRPIVRKYKDNTSETIVWEGRRVKSITTREGRTQTFVYNNKNQIVQITGDSGVVLDTITYDDAGHITRWQNADAVLEFSDFNYDGNPGKTVQSRYRNGALVDRYEQQHTWDVHGQRTHWTMPTYGGFTSTAPWTSAVDQTFDAVGNMTSLRRTLFGGSGASMLLDAVYRNMNRPDRRTVTTAAGSQIVRDYTYDSSTGLLTQLLVTANAAVVGGARVTYDGIQKSKAQLLGVSGGARSNEWTYDQRSRLQSTILALDAGSTPQLDTLTPSDFRVSLDRPSLTPVDPPSIYFTENTLGGHKIDKVQRGTVVEQYTFVGGERREDGRYAYTYDAKGRLSVVTEKANSFLMSLRRVQYAYDSIDRLVGRRAEYAVLPSVGATPAPADWKLEDRPEILAYDALPAETTFVWDPVDDHLVAIYKAGASQNASIDANGGLLRQIIHGGLVYDDPLEVAVADVDASSGVSRLYPVYDEAGAGSLQVVLNENGEIVSRSAPGGAYGEDEVILVGAAVDRVGVEPQKDDQGQLTGIVVSLRTTEQLAETSLNGGVRLAVVDNAGNVARTSSATATLGTPSTVQWALTPSEWNALVDPAPVTVNGKTIQPEALSIGVTSSLRAKSWGTASPVLPAPVWALASKSVYTSTAMPVEVRESLANLATLVSGNTPKPQPLYAVPTLQSLGSQRAVGIADPERLIVSASFHAHPFQEPMTNQNYVRARWYDVANGVWLTPDPAGYIDSPNLYAYAGGDPVNARDSSGQYEADFHYGLTMYLALQAGFVPSIAQSIAEGTERPDLKTDPRSPVPSGTKGVFGDQPARERLAQWHFPKPDVESGEVVPCSAEAREKIDRALENGNLYDFAEGLHPFEDSWSHRGKPSIGGYAGHPNDRGGAASHDTDMTYKYPDVAMVAAEATYTYLQAYALKYPQQATGDGSMPAKPVEWSTIRDDVSVFMRLQTKAEKRQWLTARGVDMPQELWDDVSLEETPPNWLGRVTHGTKNGVQKAVGGKLIPAANGATNIWNRKVKPWWNESAVPAVKKAIDKVWPW